MVREVPGNFGWILPAYGAAAGLLLGSWLYPPTLEWWDALDIATFRLLNGSLEGKRWWQVFWAAANHRAADLVPLAFIVWLFGRWVFADSARQAPRRAALLVAAIGVMLLAGQIGKLEFFEIGRKSPTLVLGDAIRLSERVPWIDAKDSSGQSFPGDHSLFLMMLAIFLWRSAGWRYGLIGTAALAVFSLPRLVGGAHWLTDDLIGSSVLALPAMGLFFGTPLHRVVAGWFEPLATWVLERWRFAAPTARIPSSATHRSS